MFDKLPITDFIIGQLLNDFILIDALVELLSQEQVIRGLEHLIVREEIKLAMPVSRYY